MSQQNEEGQQRLGPGEGEEGEGEGIAAANGSANCPLIA